MSDNLTMQQVVDGLVAARSDPEAIRLRKRLAQATEAFGTALAHHKNVGDEYSAVMAASAMLDAEADLGHDDPSQNTPSDIGAMADALRNLATTSEAVAVACAAEMGAMAAGKAYLGRGK